MTRTFILTLDYTGVPDDQIPLAPAEASQMLETLQWSGFPVTVIEEAQSVKQLVPVDPIHLSSDCDYFRTKKTL